jgi:NAD+ kinase
MESLQKPRIERVLIILKETCWRLVRTSPDSARRLKQLERGVDQRARVEAADAEHQATVGVVRTVLSHLGIRFRSVYRQSLARRHFQGVDLVIAVGGDGTFLTSTHCVEGIPVLGVNSAPSSSHGKFCLARAETFEAIMLSILAGQREPLSLLRLQLFVDGQPLPAVAMNEILVHDESPPGACRYYLSVNGLQERQLSSGIYVATPAGSTGSIRSAGGQILPLTSLSWQYLVREPFIEPGATWRFLDGVLSPGDTLLVTSLMWDGWVFVDGKSSGIKYQFPRGAQLRVQPATLPLIAYANPAANAQYPRTVRR